MRGAFALAAAAAAEGFSAALCQLPVPIKLSATL